MAVGIGNTNPELVIEVTYDTQKSQQQFNQFKTKLERNASLHEQKLKQIQERGDTQRSVSKNKFQDRLEQQEKLHQDKLRRMQEVARQKLLQQQQAYEARMLRSQTSWSARMSKNLGTLATSVKLFAAAYVATFAKSIIGSSFQFVEELKNQAESWDMNTQALQVYNRALLDANSNSEKNVKIFDKISIALSEAENGQKTFAKALNEMGINDADNVESAFLKIVDGIKKGTIELTTLVDVFGARMAGEVFRIAQQLNFEEARKNLGKNLINDEQIQKIEAYNDALDRLVTAVKVGFARAMSQSAGEGTTVVDKWAQAIGEIDWEAVGDGILVIVKALESLGKSIEGVSKASRTLFAADKFFGNLDKVMKSVSGLTTGMIKLQKVFEGKMMDKTPMAMLMKGELSGTSKFYGFLIKILGVIKPFVNALIVSYEWLNKIFVIVGKLIKPFSAVFKMIGKISVYLTAVFVIYDFVNALTKGMNVLEATLYTVLKFVTDVIDGLSWILTLGGWTPGATDWMESWGLWGESFVQSTEDAKNNMKDLMTPMKTYSSSTEGTKPTGNQFGGPGEPEKTFADNLKEQIANQVKLRKETEDHIALLNDYARQYSNNADVLKIVNEQLKEQQEILDDLNRNKKILDIAAGGTVTDIPSFKPPDLQSIDFKSQLPQELELIKSKWLELQDIMKERDATRVAIKEWEKLLEVFKDNTEAIAIIQGKISQLKAELEFEPTGFEKAVSDFAEWYAEWNQVVAQTAEFFQATWDLQVQSLYNQIEVLQEIIRLENERWSAADARMEESGIKNTAYYIKMKKDHEKYIKALEAREYKLKGDAWEADKESKIAQTIMNTAQAIMAAWSAGPLIGLIMSAIVAATGAIQLQTISQQKNPYRRALGGWIPGTGYGDSVPTMLTPGEFVVNRAAARDNAQLLELVNSGRQASSETTNVYVTVDGTIVGQDDWVEQQLVPSINKAIKKGYELRNN